MVGDSPNPPIPDMLRELAEAVGGTIEEIRRPAAGWQPGFAVMSMPLPVDHWLTRKAEKYEPPPMPFRMVAADPRREPWAEAIRAAEGARSAAEVIRSQEEADRFQTRFPAAVIRSEEVERQAWSHQNSAGTPS